MDMRLCQRIKFPCGTTATLELGRYGFYLSFSNQIGIKRYLKGIKSRYEHTISPETSYEILMERISKIKEISVVEEDYRLIILPPTGVTCIVEFGKRMGLRGTRAILEARYI